jgi:type II secretory pathway component PulJ
MSRRGFSVAEFLVSLTLIGLMLAAIGVFCKDMLVSGRVSADVQRDSDIAASLVRLGQESKTAFQVLKPPAAGTHTELEFRRLDPTRSERFPFPVPIPGPAAFNSLQPDFYASVRVWLDNNALWRQCGATRTQLLSGVRNCQTGWLADGQLQIRLEVELAGKVQVRTTRVFLPLLP